MVTSIRKGAKAHLYIQEWMEDRGLSAQRLADRVGMNRTSIHRWIKQQHRLDPPKIAQLAEALDLEPQDLWRPPGRRSLDAIIQNATDADYNAIVDFAERWLKRA